MLHFQYRKCRNIYYILLSNTTYMNSYNGIDIIGTNSGGTQFNSTTSNVNVVIAHYLLGAWNMDTTSTLNVPHNLGQLFTGVTQANGMIINDSIDVLIPVGTGLSIKSPEDCYIREINSTNIVFLRINNGYFDNNIDYDSTAVNRGYVQLTYLVNY